MVKKTHYIPERGDVVYLSFDPTRGHEQKGRRPALVISNRSYNTLTGLMIACPITSTIRDNPFVVPINSLKVKGVILSDHVRSLAWKERGAEYIGHAGQDVLKDVCEKIEVLIQTEL